MNNQDFKTLARKLEDKAMNSRTQWVMVTAVWLVAFFTIVIVGIMVTTPRAHAQANTRSFWDSSGHFAGSSSSHNNTTSFSDRDGKFSGSSIRNSDGTTSIYDARGHFSGSVTNTSPQTRGRQ